MRSRKVTRSRGLALGVVLAMTMAACGGSDDEASEPSDEPAPAATTAPSDEPSDEPAPAATAAPAAETTDPPSEEMESASIRFTWWGNPERDEKTIAMVDAFMEAHPEIEVTAEPTVFDGYFDKLAVGFAAGNAPDVMTLGGSYPTEYGNNGVLADLTALPASGIDEYDANSYSAATLDGAVYGLPTGGNALGMLVNLDLLAEAGLELPDDATWDWPDFVEWAGALSAATPEDIFGTDWRIQEVKGPFAAQRGKPLYLPEGGVGTDVETITALFQLTADLLTNNGMPSAEITTELVNTQMEQTLFGQGKAVTMAGYSNQLQGFADLLGQQVTLIKLPGESNYERPGLTVLPSQFFAIYSGSEYPEAAAMLIDWMLNEPEPAKIILANRGLSFNPTVLEAITPLLGEYEAIAAEYLGRIASEGGEFLPPPREGQGEVDDMTLRLQADVMFGNLSPADAAEEFVSEATSIVP